MNAPWRIRVDTGGTFTDAWGLGPDGRERRCKVLSDGRLRLALQDEGGGWWRIGDRELPDGILRGWRDAAGREVGDHRDGRLLLPGHPGGPVELASGEEAPVVAARLLTETALDGRLPELDFRVATTRGTNALLEHKGARVAFFVSAGFEDLLAIRDQRRAALFELRQPEARPLAELVAGVRHRCAADGTELEPLDEAHLRREARAALEAGCRVAAVALLHSWKAPQAERHVADILREEGFEQVTLSSSVAPVIRILPRAETAVADAFLAPVMRHFLERVTAPVGGREPWLMTSAGGLVPASRYQPKDSLLSGPAGGLIGAAELGRAAGFPKLLTFDMGGTSTDVARIDGPFSYRQEQQVGPARVLAPALRIETVAAGGGSICRWHQGRLEVGPESAGSDPGPACYGRGGPLTLTDVNLLLGLMDPDKAGIPLDRDAARQRFRELREEMRADGETTDDELALLNGIRSIGIERMAEAIRSVSVREGVEVRDHVLLAFGGAGPQHACAIAECLGVERVLVPADAGLLSAWGLERALRQEQSLRQMLCAPDAGQIEKTWAELAAETERALGSPDPRFRHIADLRLEGQESTIEVESPDGTAAGLPSAFARAYRSLFGYEPPATRPLELVALRVVAEEPAPPPRPESFTPTSQVGPLLIQDRFSTCVVPPGWRLRRGDRETLLLERDAEQAAEPGLRDLPEAVRAGLFRSRFEGLLDSMGEALRRTALSTNVKERLDFSCALLDGSGRLVASAPHVPVHLGALGVCVRETVARLALGPGQVAITNHPGAGGSHLPDVTLIAPVHDHDGHLIGYIANRAHHAELGGSAPGSMPANASCLAEEGVVIEPRLLVDRGAPDWDGISRLLRDSPYPSRRPGDNLADLEAQLAACHFGRQALQDLATLHGPDLLRSELAAIVARSADLMSSRLRRDLDPVRVTGELDDGTPLAVTVAVAGQRMTIDFAGTGAVHPRNLNATPAIVRSVVLYVLRLWLAEDLPLNEGLLDPVDLRIPESLLNPCFDPDPRRAPAVVGGNVELSQRLCDLLLEALGLAANGPGTMNNFLFGNDGFGYYETLAGGAGAGPGFPGASGHHVHMTNTGLTDPELMEHRYPVRVLRHEIRRGSGGPGRFRGGDGIRREIEFLEPLTVSFLTQRRLRGPRGLEGGADGQAGRQLRIKDGETSALDPSCSYRAAAGERVLIETPGGGGWGPPE